MLDPNYIALWSQGSIIPNEALNKIDLLNAEPSQGFMGVVISHDCDLARSFTQEPKVEIILGKQLMRLTECLVMLKVQELFMLRFHVERILN